MAQETMDTTAAESSYPVQYSVEYPESSSRLKALFRLILIIPIAVIYILVSGINGALFPALVFMLLFRKKYPRWWFAVNLEVERFTARVWAYFSLLRDEYPSTDEQQAVQLDFEYPDAQNDLNRWLRSSSGCALPHIIDPFVPLVTDGTAGLWANWTFSSNTPMLQNDLNERWRTTAHQVAASRCHHWIIIGILSYVYLIVLVISWIAIIITGSTRASSSTFVPSMDSSCRPPDCWTLVELSDHGMVGVKSLSSSTRSAGGQSERRHKPTGIRPSALGRRGCCKQRRPIVCQRLAIRRLTARLTLRKSPHDSLARLRCSTPPCTSVSRTGY